MGVALGKRTYPSFTRGSVGNVKNKSVKKTVDIFTFDSQLRWLPFASTKANLAHIDHKTIDYIELPLPNLGSYNNYCGT